MGFLDRFKEVIMQGSSEGEKDLAGMIMAGAAMGGAAAAAPEAVKAVTSELAQLAQSVGSNIPVMNSGDVLSIPGGGKSKGGVEIT